jgi:two-component system LytT family response regulator
VRLYSHSVEQLVRQTMNRHDARLYTRRFERVHRGENVALATEARLEPWTHGDALLTLNDGATVVLSRTHRENFVQRWGMTG